MIPGDRILRMKEVLLRTGLHRATIYRKMADRSFPEAVHMGPNSVGWYESEFEEWMANPVEFRTAPRAA